MAGNGGARPGAGRKAKAEKFKQPIAKAEKRIADRLPSLIDNMLILANGGYERVEEQWARADSLYIGSGADAKRMYPEAEDDELVLVKRTVSIADRDRQANQYLIDRIMGKATQRIQGRMLNITPEQLAKMSDDDLDELERQLTGPH